MRGHGVCAGETDSVRHVSELPSMMQVRVTGSRICTKILSPWWSVILAIDVFLHAYLATESDQAKAGALLQVRVKESLDCLRSLSQM